MPEMLKALPYAKCVASSGPPEKIRESLALSGLAGYFGENVFNSYVVKSWKPEPGLFLHAAAAMGFAASRCVVVEDSEPGIQAAQAAGMAAVQFAPTRSTAHHPYAHPLSHMSELPVLLAHLCAE